MKRTIRLTESDLKHIIKKSVGKILREFGSDGPDWDEPRVYNDFDYSDFYSRMSPTGPSQSANDFDTDEQLLNLNGEDFDDEDLDLDDESLELSDIQDLDLESKRRMGRILRESIRNVLNEGAKAVDPNNVVPQELAKKFGFHPEYADEASGLEIWGNNINGFHRFGKQRGRHDYSPQELLYSLGIKRFTDMLNLPGGKTRVRITVEGGSESGMRTPWGDRRSRMVGDYVDTEWADKDGAIFHNPNNGHTKRIKQGF